VQLKIPISVEGVVLFASEDGEVVVKAEELEEASEAGVVEL